MVPSRSKLGIEPKFAGMMFAGVRKWKETIMAIGKQYENGTRGQHNAPGRRRSDG